MTFRVHIFPVLGNSNISAIKPMDIQCFINNFGDSRTGEKAYKLLKPVFDYAVASGIIERSPMALIKKPYHEPESGVALTIEEERVFLAALEGSEYKFLFICILYLGLRRSEVKSIVFDENFVTVVSAKQRRGRREQVRRIPITPMLRKYLPRARSRRSPTTPFPTFSNVFVPSTTFTTFGIRSSPVAKSAAFHVKLFRSGRDIKPMIPLRRMSIPTFQKISN